MNWFTDRLFRKKEHLAQTETLVSPSDCEICNRLNRAIRYASPHMAVEIRVQLDIHCRTFHPQAAHNG